jgi:hypothetical protein
MSEQNRQSIPNAGLARKLEEIVTNIARQIPNLSPENSALMRRAIKVLARNTRAGAERLAILHLLGTNESVPGRVLYQLCNKRVGQRVRELRAIGMDIRHWGETGPDGMGYDVYGWMGFKQWQAYRILNEDEEKQPSLKRVM